MSNCTCPSRGESPHSLDCVMSGSERERTYFRELIDSLLDTYRPEGVVIWLASYNRSLGDSPRNLIAADDWPALFAAADRLAGGAR